MNESTHDTLVGSDRGSSGRARHAIAALTVAAAVAFPLSGATAVFSPTGMVLAERMMDEEHNHNECAVRDE